MIVLHYFLSIYKIYQLVETLRYNLFNPHSLNEEQFGPPKKKPVTLLLADFHWIGP